MKRGSSGNGKWWLLFALALAGALWFRLRHHGSDDPTPPRPPETPVTEPRPAATPVARAPTSDAPQPTDAATALDPDPAAAPRSSLYESEFSLAALSTDGKRALLVIGDGAIPKSLRVVVIDTGKVEVDVAFTAYGSDAPQDTELVDELVRARAALRGFPFGAGRSLATTPDGAAGAYTTTDAINTMRGASLGAKLNIAAAYDPLILPDGKTLMVRGYHGRVADNGVYALVWATLGDPTPHAIDGTIDVDSRWHAPPAGDVLRFMIRDVPRTSSCVVEVPLVKPFKVSRRRCLDNTEYFDLALSPSGNWVAWQTRLAENAPVRLRTMNVETGEIGIDVPDSNADGLALTDTGRLVAEAAIGSIEAIDPKTLARRPVTITGRTIAGCIARGDHELICEKHGSVEVVELAGGAP